VGKIAKAYTTNPRSHAHAHSAERKGDVEHRFVTVTHDGKVARLISELGADERGLTLVFVRTKRGADRLVKRLATSSVRAVAMHGDKSQGQRERALANFEAGVVDTLVATDVAARGIDVAGITHVINYDIPATREDYVHRIGRTARAGASGVGVTLVAHDQTRELSGMIRELGLDRELALAGISSGGPQRSAGAHAPGAPKRSHRGPRRSNNANPTAQRTGGSSRGSAQRRTRAR
jgi:superfamily II DNA/RNA helicase